MAWRLTARLGAPRRAGGPQFCITEIPRHATGLPIACAAISRTRADGTMSPKNAKSDAATTAKLLVVLLAFAWGFNWIAAAVALREVSPWSLRFDGAGIGAATLFAAALLTGHDLRVPRGELLPCDGGRIFQRRGVSNSLRLRATQRRDLRAIIITYSMPIWTTMLSALVLGERLHPHRHRGVRVCASPAGRSSVAAVRATDFRPSCSIRSAAR